MWPGLFFAFVLAALTARSYSELAAIFAEAGTGLGAGGGACPRHERVDRQVVYAQCRNGARGGC